MFGLFINDVFFSFWQNSIGDIFLVNTVSSLGLNLDHVDLAHYPGVRQPPAHFSFDNDKNLIIKNKIITPTQVATLNENGEPVLDENLDPTYHNEDVITYEVDSTIMADFYCAKGILVKAC